MDTPETHYALTSDRVDIAYQVSGRGSLDLLWTEGWLSRVEILWELPSYARWMHALGEHFRVIHFDKRGIGLSDPQPRLRPHPVALQGSSGLGATIRGASGPSRAADP